MDKHYIGVDKPKIVHVIEIPPSQFEDSDNNPADPEQAGWEPFKEDE